MGKPFDHVYTVIHIFWRLLEYILQENAISVYLLQNFLFNPICYLMFHCNYLWDLFAQFLNENFFLYNRTSTFSIKHVVGKEDYTIRYTHYW